MGNGKKSVYWEPMEWGGEKEREEKSAGPRGKR